MTEFLVRHFVKDYEAVEKSAVRTAYGVLASMVGIVCNVFLFLVKFIVGLLLHSVSVTADAFNNLSDAASSIISFIGVKMAGKPADKEHPFGHGRWEQISALIIAILLALVGVEFMKDAIAKLRGHEAADFGWLAYLATVASIVLKEGLARYAFYIARKTGNAAVKADGWHHRSDALSSLMVLAGLFLSPYFWWIDSVLGMLISFMLFYAAYGIIREAVNKILGEEPSEEVIGKVEQIVKAEMGNVAYPHHYHIHHYGDHIEFTFHIKVPGEETVEEAHRKATLIEMQIKTELKIDATIHIEPLKM